MSRQNNWLTQSELIPQLLQPLILWEIASQMQYLLDIFLFLAQMILLKWSYWNRVRWTVSRFYSLGQHYKLYLDSNMLHLTWLPIIINSWSQWHNIWYAQSLNATYYWLKINLGISSSMTAQKTLQVVSILTFVILY